MIILIDGYNLLNHVFPGKRHVIDKHKQLLIKHLGLYKHHKPSIKEIILVFDGGISNHASRMVKEGVVIIESGVKNTADDWLIAFVARNRGREILLITLDRALREQIERLGASWLSVFDFHHLMLALLAEATSVRGDAMVSDVVVYERDEDCPDGDGFGINKQALDMLMEQASLDVQAKREDQQRALRKGKSYTPSKLEKQIAAKIKKLG